MNTLQTKEIPMINSTADNRIPRGNANDDKLSMPQAVK